jgi:hypothetical protein
MSEFLVMLTVSRRIEWVGHRTCVGLRSLEKFELRSQVEDTGDDKLK